MAVGERNRQLEQELEKRAAQAWIKNRIARFTQLFRAFITVLSLALVLLLQVPALKGPLAAAGFNEVSALSLSIIVFMLGALFFEVRNLVQEKEVQESELTHFESPMDLYPHMLDRMREIKRKDQKVLSVLGISLFTAWPSIRFHLNDPVFDGWTVQFTAVVVADDGLRQYVPDGWTPESERLLDEIVRDSNGQHLAERGIKLRAYSYGFMPVIHGFQLGNGDLYFSFLPWEDGKLARDKLSYDYLSHNNESRPADNMRKVFTSWWLQASAQDWSARQPQA